MLLNFIQESGLVYGGHVYSNSSSHSKSVDSISNSHRRFDVIRNRLVQKKRKFGASIIEAMRLESILRFFDRELSSKLDSSVRMIDRFAFDAVAGLANIQSVIIIVIFNYNQNGLTGESMICFNTKKQLFFIAIIVNLGHRRTSYWRNQFV